MHIASGRSVGSVGVVIVVLVFTSWLWRVERSPTKKLELCGLNDISFLSMKKNVNYDDWVWPVRVG